MHNRLKNIESDVLEDRILLLKSKGALSYLVSP